MGRPNFAAPVRRSRWRGPRRRKSRARLGQNNFLGFVHLQHTNQLHLEGDGHAGQRVVEVKAHRRRRRAPPAPRRRSCPAPSGVGNSTTSPTWYCSSGSPRSLSSLRPTHCRMSGLRSPRPRRRPARSGRARPRPADQALLQRGESSPVPTDSVAGLPFEGVDHIARRAGQAVMQVTKGTHLHDGLAGVGGGRQRSLRSLYKLPPL